MKPEKLSEEERRKVFEQLKNKFDGKVTFKSKQKSVGIQKSQYSSRVPYNKRKN
jgi:hypothetical protein